MPEIDIPDAWAIVLPDISIADVLKNAEPTGDATKLPLIFASQLPDSPYGIIDDTSTPVTEDVLASPSRSFLGRKLDNIRLKSSFSKIKVKISRGLSKTKEELPEVEQKSVEVKEEGLLRSWLTKEGIPASFESDLLGGRIELSGIQVSYICKDNVAVRVFEEDSSIRIMDKAVMEAGGYKVIDIIPSDIYDANKFFDKALSNALVRKNLRG